MLKFPLTLALSDRIKQIYVILESDMRMYSMLVTA
jgi:hypothetical protein